MDRNQKQIAPLKTLQDLRSVEEKQAERRGWGRQAMNQPLESLEDLILASLNPRAITGLPHPLSKFAANGMVKEGPYADAIIEFIKDWTCEAPESVRQRAAMWFLFQSERAFFVACSEAGIDAERLRNHLRLRQRLNADQNEGRP